MYQVFSKNGWLDHWRYKEHRDFIAGKDNELEEGGNWIHSKSIKIYDLSEKSGNCLVDLGCAVKSVLDDVGLDFVIDVNSDEAKNENFILELSRCYNHKRRINPDEFLKITFDEYRGDDEGKIFIIDRELSNHVDFGLSDFAYGCSIVNAGFAQDAQALQTLMRHETFHLLGYDADHENNEVAGYDDADCLMSSAYRIERSCSKCLDALIEFWKGIEDRTEEDFFR